LPSTASFIMLRSRPARAGFPSPFHHDVVVA
jgi:hypothetical protein